MDRRWLVAVLMLVLLPACGGTAQTGTSVAPFSPDTSEVSAPAAASEPTMAPAAGAAGPGAEGESAGNTAANGADDQTKAPLGRMVIRNATLSLLVTRADEAERAVRALIDRLGGYVLESSTTGDVDARSVRLSFKVPSERFDAAINEIEALAIKVQARSITGQDVTEEFVDTESRIQNLEATEARVREFLVQAKNVEEALRVNQQLTEIQGQLEQARGRIEFLKNNVSFSTISLDLQPELAPVPLPTPTALPTWQPGAVARDSWQSLLGFAQVLANIAIALAIWSPVWGLILLIGFLGLRRLGRRVPPPQTPPQSSDA